MARSQKAKPASSGGRNPRGTRTSGTGAASAAATSKAGKRPRQPKQRTHATPTRKNGASEVTGTSNTESLPPVQQRVRCFGSYPDHAEYAVYHDTEWGIPVHDDLKHFEILTLEGAQAGLSFETILKKREGYRKRFKGLDPAKCAKLTDSELKAALEDPDIVRHRQKVPSVRQNARAFLSIQKEHGSFDQYVWAFVNHTPVVTVWKKGVMPPPTDAARALSLDLKKRGMTFVGPTIVHAYMQAAGLVSDHSESCWRAAA